MLRYIFGMIAFGLALWAAAARAQSHDFIYAEVTVQAHAPQAFTSDDPNLRLHIHGASAIASERRAYARVERQLDAIPACLTAEGHPPGQYDLTRVNWASFDDDKAIEVCMFRLINFVGTDQIHPYFTALGFAVHHIKPFEETVSYETGETRMVQAYSIGLIRDRRWTLHKAPNQALFRGTLFPRAASIHLSTSDGEITHIQFSLNTL